MAPQVTHKLGVVRQHEHGSWWTVCSLPVNFETMKTGYPVTCWECQAIDRQGAEKTIVNERRTMGPYVCNVEGCQEMATVMISEKWWCRPHWEASPSPETTRYVEQHGGHTDIISSNGQTVDA